jgi:hypothetical protein
MDVARVVQKPELKTSRRALLQAGAAVGGGLLVGTSLAATTRLLAARSRNWKAWVLLRDGLAPWTVVFAKSWSRRRDWP